ncbi:MAG TPA: lytic transglycosylase [Micromonosporaceae bacterium]|nr:lytic transglycosylase [Micromonosporaceae bacterium]
MEWKRKHALWAMAAVVVLILAGGVVLVARSALTALAKSPSVPSSPSTYRSPSPSPSPSESPSPSPSLSQKPSPTGPPPPPPAPKPCRYEGKRASESQVKAALEAAAAKEFWQNSAKISLPPKLIKAVAQHESGWQSNAVSCAGAYGVMQVMPDTQTWMNQRFAIEPNYDRKTLTGNTMLGSAYLQWLIKEMGDKHFGGDYAIRSCATSTDKCLLNAVIAAYEVGHQAVHDELTDGDSVHYPNPDYVANVRYWMAKY